MLIKHQERPRIFHGWIVAIVSAITMGILAGGVRFSFPVFYVSILDDFGWSRAKTASIYSLHSIVSGMMAPLAGVLYDRFGPKKVILTGIIIAVLALVGCGFSSSISQFYLSFGVFAALGLTLGGMIPHQAALSNWFNRKRGRAFGMLHAGMGIGQMWPLLAQALISNVGWRMAYRITAAIVAAITLPIVYMFQGRRPKDMGLVPDGIAESPDEARNATAQDRRGLLAVNEKWASTDWTLSRTIRTYRFWALALALFCWFGMGMLLTITHQVAFLVDIGFSAGFAASIASTAGLVNAGACLTGFISDRLGREKAFTLGGVIFILAILMLFLVKDTSSPWMLYLFVVFWGVGTGIGIPAIIAAEADLFQGRHFGAIIGTLTMATSLGGILGPWLGGRIYDVTDSYDYAWVTAMAAIGASCLLLWVASPRKVMRVPGQAPKAL
ncbi:MFS transporter [Chloroflexota bacterium]